MPVLRAIVFDLDDTLYPEKDYVLSGFRAVAAWAQEHLNIPASKGFAELRGLFQEGVRNETFNRWLESHGLEPGKLVSQLVRVYREHNPQIVPYPEVPGLLQRLRRRYHLGLVTDGYLTVQQRKLTALALASYFDAIVFSDAQGREAWKPNPQPFKMVLKRLGVQGPETVYVADNPLKDFIGARRVGMWTVRIRRPEGLYGHLRPPSPEYAPHTEIESLAVLETTLKSLENLCDADSHVVT